MLQSNRLSIYAIGKIKKHWIRDGINQYKKRMPELIINESKTFNLAFLTNFSRISIPNNSNWYSLKLNRIETHQQHNLYPNEDSI